MWYKEIMGVIHGLFGKPDGSKEQIEITEITRQAIIYGELLPIMAMPFMFAYRSEVTSTIIALYTLQLILAGTFAYGYLEPRVEKLKSVQRTNQPR
jgi:hypothetical protein